MSKETQIRLAHVPKREADVFEMLVIYDKPKDCPTMFVVRRWLVGKGSMVPCQDPWLFDTYARAREWCQEFTKGFGTVVPRQPGDDKVIVEAWIVGHEESMKIAGLKK